MKEEKPISEEGDIAIRIGNTRVGKHGQMYSRQGDSITSKYDFKYDKFREMAAGDWRQATPSEKRAFADGIKNVNDIKDLMLEDAYQIY